MGFQRSLWGVGLLLGLWFSGCAHHYPVNPILKECCPGSGYRLKKAAPASEPKELLLFLTFSGGGTRAAAFSYGVLEELAATQATKEGAGRKLIDEVDIISSVSGGSFTAAYYGLFGKRIFRDFEGQFLKENIQRNLLRQTLQTDNWPRLWSGHFGRSDLAAEYYHRNIFEGATFGDLEARGRPMILINATDITSGNIFTFTQETFDIICSDISKFPVARAVAASSAIPLLLSPITLHNFAGSCGYREPAWVRQALENPSRSKRRFYRAVHWQYYQDVKKKPFIHLMDGGLSDNLGLRALIDRLTQEGSFWLTLQSLGWEKARKIVFIIVNAEKEPETDPDYRERTLNSASVLKSVARIPILRYNLETVDLLKEYLFQWKEEIRSQRCRFPSERNLDVKTDSRLDPCGDLEFYMIEVDFNALSNRKQRDYFQRLPTSFSLTPEAVDQLREAGRRVLRDSPEFQRLLHDLHFERALMEGAK